MPPRREIKDKVILTNHGRERWEERVKCSSKNIDRLLTAILREQLAMGMLVRDGQAILKVSANRYGLEQDLEIPLEFPDARGVWLVTTILFKTA